MNMVCFRSLFLEALMKQHFNNLFGILLGISIFVMAMVVLVLSVGFMVNAVFPPRMDGAHQVNLPTHFGIPILFFIICLFILLGWCHDLTKEPCPHCNNTNTIFKFLLVRCLIERHFIACKRCDVVFYRYVEFDLEGNQHFGGWALSDDFPDYESLDKFSSSD